MNEHTTDQTEAAAEVEVADVGQPKPRAKSKASTSSEYLADPNSALDVAGEPEDAKLEADATEPESQPQSTAATNTDPVVYPYAVTGDRDDVYLDKCVVKNKFNRKSLTVHHLQRRLVELGYPTAADDRDGYYSDGTIDAVASWQTDNDLEATGIVDATTFQGIFNNDPIVIVHA
jgi:peptidoglycan hydrolase-like protein with peptidoglycan-binding domain